jgi:hypothetical protein
MGDAIVESVATRVQELQDDPPAGIVYCTGDYAMALGVFARRKLRAMR